MGSWAKWRVDRGQWLATNHNPLATASKEAMPDAFILSAARTPIGRARKGSLISIDAYQLAEIAVGAAVERSQFPVADLDDLFLAESLQGGGVIGRNIAVRLGMTNVPGVAINRHCASGATAVQLAAATIMAGMADVIVAGGTESASTMPRLAKVAPGAQDQPDGRRRAIRMPPAFPPSICRSPSARTQPGSTMSPVNKPTPGPRAHNSERSTRLPRGTSTTRSSPSPSTKAKSCLANDEHPRGTTPETLAGLKVLHPGNNRCRCHRRKLRRHQRRRCRAGHRQL